jgi:hypothetical protein
MRGERTAVLDKLEGMMRNRNNRRPDVHFPGIRHSSIDSPTLAEAAKPPELSYALLKSLDNSLRHHRAENGAFSPLP